MSFVEKNKAWLLPLLGVGALAVLWMNIRVFSPQTPAPGPSAPPEASASPTPGPAPADPSAAPAPVPPPPPAGTASGADLWEDLRGLATPPPALANEATFQDSGRRSALAALRPTALAQPLPIPAGVREPAPAPEPKGKAESAHVEEGPPPPLDFLIHGPAGARAWFDGHPYQAGDPIGPPQRSVGAIGTTTVELKSPKGKTVLSTNPFHHTGPAPRPAVEAP